MKLGVLGVLRRLLFGTPRLFGNMLMTAHSKLTEIVEQLLDHRSVRAFTDRHLPEGTIETLIAAAQSASTSSNLQVWSVVAVQDVDRRKRLFALAGNQAYIHQAPLFLVWLADLSRVSRIAEQQGVELEALPYLESLLLRTIDAALAAQNAVVALESRGLGACTSVASVTTSKALPKSSRCRLRSIPSSACASAIHHLTDLQGEAAAASAGRAAPRDLFGRREERSCGLR